MRANTTLVIELPATVAEIIVALANLTEHLAEPTVWQGSYIERDHRDGTPAQIAMTISGAIL